MCGIVGFISNRYFSNIGLTISEMADTLQHRGPDDAGIWVDTQAGIALGHRRLSILDLSAAGHQPMVSESGRYVIVFNGEIYNHQSVRAELQTHSITHAWHGHSDTETILAAFEYWGVETTLTKLVGMFAIALWDRTEKSIFLARDRMGEKPLYYGWINGDIAFGSELKALRNYPGFSNVVNRDALALLIQFTYIPAPYSIYQNIYKLEPGCLLRLNITNNLPLAPIQPLRPPFTHDSITLSRWWSLSRTVELGATTQIIDEIEAVAALKQRLSTAVSIQSIADVPIGSFLSGGVDSSTITAVMQSQSSRPIKTFTVGFEDAGFNESPYALAVAKHLGTDHTEFFVTAAETREIISQLPFMYDEPFADASQIPTHLVCKAAKQKVTVALSGDAGDELFGGYNKYLWPSHIWNRFNWLPFPMRRLLGLIIARVPITAWNAIGYQLRVLIPSLRRIMLGDKAHRLSTRLMSVHNLDDLYKSLASELQNYEQLVLDGTNKIDLINNALPLMGAKEYEEQMMYQDSLHYLPDDILCKIDRAAMFVGLETRVPFLDHRVVELAWQLPLNMKIRKNKRKWILRQLLYQYVPSKLIERPKAGFSIPIGIWLRGSLRDWAENLLAESRLRDEGFFDPAYVRTLWSEHLSQQRDWQFSLWSILMFQAWLEKQAK